MERKLSRVAFPYAVASTVTISLVIGVATMAGLLWWETLIGALGACLFISMIIFTLFEVRRIAGISRSHAERLRDEQEADREARHTVIVQPPTGQPYPHHENDPGTEGFDQGQLTARIPCSTPVVEEWLSKRAKPAEPKK